MDFAEPLQALIPGATGRVLAVLVHTSTPMSGRSVADLAGVSPAQAGRVLGRLAELGIVQAQSAPPAILYSLDLDHVAAEPLQALSSAPARLVERLAERIAQLDPQPVSVGAYGSFARRQAQPESDIDLVVVRSSDVDEDDDEWADTVEAIRSTAAGLSGNPVEILEVGQQEVRSSLRSRSELWRNIARDFLPIFGPELDAL